ncbi:MULTISPECIES: AzlC family ABC transporter permease [Phaeobacter]|uniref:Branched-chain amino acid permease (Azaleucine resistance) n=1 Tax=Phaeobacter piscinae TaxID=1580596 RepID=A0ABN5DLF0_9RHOB|nr:MULTISPECIES: AzlC family ABC transporter permease [Phaeobacter]ATG37574.1 putative branched-chain amino acid permease (azaleucine resistance) [Phaeobacter piscinae]AUQ88095.1 putative branched-chain amino acid permease (azaleucine resistance) [Phaeobacter piscinae]AUR25978.1 putative branched-chain amino acid permease (azaleucine resistance) [Phaeobacter piscinae]KII11588.1 branched-chain amino acid permease [Phaeobacter sp. S60]
MTHNTPHIPTAALAQGALAILPLALGASLYGFAFGVLAAQIGFPWWGIATMSGLVHAGSSQIVAVEQFSSGSALLGAVLAGAALNLRYIGIVASLIPLLHGLPLWTKLLTIHMTGDENWALTMTERAKDPQIGAGFLIGSGCVMISVWTLSTALGALVGSSFGDLERFGLGFAFTAAFIAMARGLWNGTGDLAPWTASFVASFALVTAQMPTAYAILLGTLTGVAVLVLNPRRKVPAQ